MTKFEPLILRVLAVLFGGTFIYAGVVKASDPGLFLIDIRSYDMPIMHDPHAAWLAISLPCRLAFGTLRLFPRRLQERVINVLARKSVGQADELGRGQVPGKFETILDVFEKVAVAP